MVESHEEDLYLPTAEEIEIFEAARALNPKRFHNHHHTNKCATIDCHYVAVVNSIFCYACDNERSKPLFHPSGSPSAEIARRRRAIEDHKKGIAKATL